VPGQERRLKTLGLLDDEGGSTYDAFFKDGIAWTPQLMWLQAIIMAGHVRFEWRV